MRRPFFAVLAVLACVVIAGCGSSSTSGASNPTLRTLSYFPSTSPFVVTVPTNPKASGIKNAKALQQQFPQATVLQTALFARLGQLGIDYNKQIRPLFGNPIAFGVLSAQTSQTPFLGVWVTKNTSALATLVKKLGPALQSNGTHDGAKLYGLGNTALAIDGPTVLIGRTPQDIDAALDRHKAGQGFSSAEYRRLTGGTAGGESIQMFGDVSQALSTPQSAQARRIPWVAAIKGYGASLDFAPSGLTMRFHIDTTGRSLSASQLPLAAGSSPPGVVADAPIQMGVRDLTQPIRFAEAAVQAVHPAQYASFRRSVGKLRSRSGLDFDALVATLTGTFNISSDTKTTIARVGVSNPSAVAGMLTKFAAAPGRVFKKGAQVSRLPGGLYTVQEPGNVKLTMGVVGNQLLLGRATPAQIRAFAKASTTSVPGASGAVSLRIAMQNLLRLTLKRAPSPAAQQLLNRLGDLTGSASATTGGLDGIAKLALK